MQIRGASSAVQQYLHMALWLHESAHDAVDAVQALVFYVGD